MGYLFASSSLISTILFPLELSCIIGALKQSWFLISSLHLLPYYSSITERAPHVPGTQLFIEGAHYRVFSEKPSHSTPILGPPHKSHLPAEYCSNVLQVMA